MAIKVLGHCQCEKETEGAEKKKSNLNIIAFKEARGQRDHDGISIQTMMWQV